MSYLDLTIKELHDAYVAKKVTPKEVVFEAIARAKSDDNNAFEYIMEKEAIAALDKLGEVEVDNMLWGIPFAIKDNLSTKDVPTTAGSNILNGYVPLYDATVVKKLLEKKAIPIAKTTLDELAMGGTGTSGHLGITFNPYDSTHTRLVGGSSSGSASSVASAIVPFALASDTGDSIRKPAAYAGLVGFKPTWSRLSRYGLFSFAPSLDTVGYFTRSTEDAAILLNTLAGRDDNDSTSSNRPIDNYVTMLDTPLSNFKIARIKEIDEAVSDAEILEKYHRLIDELVKKGAIVEEVSVPKKILESLFPTYFVISCAEATSNNANLDGIKFGPYYDGKTYQEVMMKARTNGFSEWIKRRFIFGSFALMKENQNALFLRAQKARHRLVETINKIFEKYDYILTIAAPTVAPLINDNSLDKLSDEYLIADNHLVIGNFGGYPSITLPLGFKDDLPYAINLTAKPFEEMMLFALSKKVEDITKLKNVSARNLKK